MTGTGRLTPAVFLDKDGTLVRDVPFNVDPRRVRLLPGTIDGLGLLQDAGFQLLVVTNQSGIALGKFPDEAVGILESHLRGLLLRSGVCLRGFFYCPHHPDGCVNGYNCVCSCRKPEPGLLHQAARAHGVDMRHSWMVGDILNDIEAGRRAGCRTVMIDNGGETEWHLTPQRRPHFRVGNLLAAARCILRHHEAVCVSQERHCA